MCTSSVLTFDVKVLGDVLRKYAVRLFWTPNFLVSALPTTADSLYEQVPDFGG
jgi:hypothetical protein